MKKSLLFSLAILFFLLINIQPASAYVSGATTCCTLSGCFDVKGTCSVDADCGSDEYCDYWGALCAGFGGPCKPLNCKDCQVAENHQCVTVTAPSGSPDCCGYSCIEGGSLYDQMCYAYTNKLTDANNCGSCGNKCPGDQICTSGSCACPSSKPNWNPSTKQCESPVIPPPPACLDGTPENSCCTTPGQKCLKNTITGLYSCTKDSSCPTCLDNDGKGTAVADTCKDTAGGLCDAFQAGGSKCADTCASNGAVNEYYCSNNACKSETITCGSSSFCSYGKCDSGSGGGENNYSR